MEELCVSWSDFVVFEGMKKKMMSLRNCLQRGFGNWNRRHLHSNWLQGPDWDVLGWNIYVPLSHTDSRNNVSSRISFRHLNWLLIRNYLLVWSEGKNKSKSEIMLPWEEAKKYLSGWMVFGTCNTLLSLRKSFIWITIIAYVSCWLWFAHQLDYSYPYWAINFGYYLNLKEL